MSRNISDPDCREFLKNGALVAEDARLARLQLVCNLGAADDPQQRLPS